MFKYRLLVVVFLSNDNYVVFISSCEVQIVTLFLEKVFSCEFLAFAIDLEPYWMFQSFSGNILKTYV